MKNLKIILGLVLVFTAFGFTLISQSDYQKETEVVPEEPVMINTKYAEHQDAFE